MKVFDKFKVGQLVWDCFHGEYCIIRKIKPPYTLTLEQCESEGAKFDEHFTNAIIVSQREIEQEIKEVEKKAEHSIAEWKKIGKMGGYKL